MHLCQGRLTRVPCRAGRTEVVCFGYVGAVAGDDEVAVAKIVMNVREREAQETGVEDGLEKDGDRELNKLNFRIAGDL